MTSWHEELVNIMTEEKRLLTELISIVSEERDAIVGLRSQELERILRKKEGVLIKLSMWEAQRTKLLEENGLTGKTMSHILEEIEDSVQPEILGKLKELFTSMKALLSSIGEIQRINEQLIDRSLLHIGTALKFLETFGITPQGTLSREA